MRIRRLGRYLEVDERGEIVKIASPELLQEEWRESVEAARVSYLERWGEALHSIYLRGSLARGGALEGASDLDTLAVFRDGEGRGGKVAGASPSDAEWEHWSREETSRLEERFPRLSGVELVCIPYRLAVSRQSVFAFIIAVEAVCLEGEDLTPLIGSFKPGPEAAFQIRHFPEHLEVFRREFPREGAEERAATLVWLMRRFLRLGMELVMERERRYTRDLYLCWESFARHYPERRGEMFRALELAIDPVADRASETFALGFGEWLAAEARQALAGSQAGGPVDSR